jgi:hypothetical protein
MACGTDPVSIIPPVVKLNLNLKNNVDVDKSVHYPQTMVSLKTVQPVPLSDRSNPVRRCL